MSLPSRAFPVRTEEDHARALRLIERLWDAPPGSAKEDLLDIMVTLAEAYEARNHPIDPPHPVDAIRFRMEQGGYTRGDLARLLGSRSHASEALSRKRPLSLEMIRRLHGSWGIPLTSLIGAA